MRLIIALFFLFTSILSFAASINGVIEPGKYYAFDTAIDDEKPFPQDEYEIMIVRIKALDGSNAGKFSVKQYPVLFVNALIKPVSYVPNDNGSFKVTFNLGTSIVASNKDNFLPGNPNKEFKGNILFTANEKPSYDIEGVVTFVNKKPGVLVLKNNPYFDLIFDNRNTLVVIVKQPIKVKVNLHD